eukprot:gene24399-29495_t
MLRIFYVTLVLIGFRVQGRVIEKVCIAGCGITGLTLANALQKFAPSVKTVAICDARSNPLQPQIGGGLQLTSGAQVLNKLGLLTTLEQVAHPFNGVICKDSQLNTLFSLSIRDLKSTPGNRDMLAVSIMRDALLRLLHEHTLPAPTLSSTCPEISYHFNHKITSITENTEAGHVDVCFANAESMQGFDLVVGADDTFARGSVDDEFHQYMGKGVYALCSTYGNGHAGVKTKQHMLAVVYKEEQGEGKVLQNGDWNTSPTATTMSFLTSLLDKGGLTRVEEIQNLLSYIQSKAHADKTRVFDIPVKDRLLPLSTWCSDSGKVVLAGDAAHPLPPFLGQGANQGMQDALCLAQAIQQHNDDVMSHRSAHPSSSMLHIYMKQYEQARKGARAELALKGRVLGEVEVLPGQTGLLAKSTFFRVMAALRVIEKEFVQGTKIRVG